MAEFKPYSITRGGFATPRELFMSVVKDLTQFYGENGKNAFEIVYPTDISDLDFNDGNSASNDVVIVQATSNVDPCVSDGTAEQPWVIRFDTRSILGHGMGHINVTTPLQIDWSKSKAPAIPYIPPHTRFDPDAVKTEGTLGFIGLRVPDGDDAIKATSERGFINRSIYHTRVAQVQQADEFGNLMWELRSLSDTGKVQEIWSSRRQVPQPGLDDLGRVTYAVDLEWHELMNTSEVDLSARFPNDGSKYTAGTQPEPVEYTVVEGLAVPAYQLRKCRLYFKHYSGFVANTLEGNTFTTFKVEGDLPPSFAARASDDSPRNADNVPQEVTFTYGDAAAELQGWKVDVKDADTGRYTFSWVVSWVKDPVTSGKWTVTEEVVTDLDELYGDSEAREQNRGLEVYDNTRYELVPKDHNSFDTQGAPRDPREGALNVPMSYALTVSGHGIVLAVWDQAVDQYETDEGHRFSWVNIQRLADKDTGKPLVDQTKSYCPLFCVYGVYHEKVKDSYYFVVRESDVHRPSEELPAGEDSPDSNAVLNTYEQVAVSEDYEYVITVPSGLNTQRYLYLEEADNIGYTSADVISNGALSEFAMYDEGVCSITGHDNEADCKANGGDWTSTTRLYRGLPSTGKYNTGMRMLMRWYGGRLGTNPSESI